MLALLISDVPGDDPAAIASGPTVGDLSTPADARAILARWQIPVPPSVAEVLAGPTGVLPPGAPELTHAETRVIAAPSQSLEAAADAARAAGCAVRLLGDAVEGEAREVAAAQARLALETRAGLRPGDPPVLLLSGGECTVTRRGDGTGGPNAEFALALALALDGAPGIAALACDTDGVDGAAEVAGATVDPGTLARARARGLDAAAALARNDSHGFFAALGDQVVTGPTLTNVNDFRAILVAPDPAPAVPDAASGRSTGRLSARAQEQSTTWKATHIRETFTGRQPVLTRGGRRVSRLRRRRRRRRGSSRPGCG